MGPRFSLADLEAAEFKGKPPYNRKDGMSLLKNSLFMAMMSALPTSSLANEVCPLLLKNPRESTIAQLEKLNVAYKRVVVNDQEFFELLPMVWGDENEKLSRYIASVYQKLGKLRFQVNDEYLIQEETFGFMDPALSRLVVKVEDFSQLGLSPVVSHEIRHAFQEQLLARGKDSLFHGSVVNNVTKKIADIPDAWPYAEFMVWDEISSYAIDLRVAASRVRDAKTPDELKVALDLVDHAVMRGAALTEQAERVAQAILDAQEKGTFRFEVTSFRPAGSGRETLRVFTSRRNFIFDLVFPGEAGNAIVKIADNTEQRKQAKKLFNKKLNALLEVAMRTKEEFTAVKTIRKSDPEAVDRSLLFEACSRPRSTVLKAEKEWLRASASGP